MSKIKVRGEWCWDYDSSFLILLCSLLWGWKIVVIKIDIGIELFFDWLVESRSRSSSNREVVEVIVEEIEVSLQTDGEQSRAIYFFTFVLLG